MKTFILVGNPNGGKTTFFNALTGEHQRVGNWPGVTVEQKKGTCVLNTGISSTIIDLPGIYSLDNQGDALSEDERITKSVIEEKAYDGIINIVDACHLERHLYLTTQLVELEKPFLIVLTMVDVAKERGITIDIKKLQKVFGTCVIPVNADKGTGMDAVISALPSLCTSKALVLPLSNELVDIKQKIVTIYEALGASLSEASYHALRLLANDKLAFERAPSELQPIIQKDLHSTDIFIADARYRYLHELVISASQRKKDVKNHITAVIDSWVLNRYMGIPIFLLMMYGMFFFAIQVGGVFQDAFDIGTAALFVEFPAHHMTQWHLSPWLTTVFAYGIGRGINTTLTFIPVMASMYFFLAFLETSGYMARAAFVVDKAMRWFGLPGKSFVPMIIGFGCNVPAIVSARTLGATKEKYLTILMTPFMSCSARLAIYSVFVAAFFPNHGAALVFSLYLIGIILAVFTGWFLRKTLLQGDPSPLILELPLYHRPSLSRLLRETYRKLKHFIHRAGRLIVPVCMILGILNVVTIHGTFLQEGEMTQSLLSYLGHLLTPIFSPMGITDDNWPATVGLLTGIMAKEVVIGTLNALYQPMAGLSSAVGHTDFSLLASLREALWSIADNAITLYHHLIHPWTLSLPDSEMPRAIYGVMADKFHYASAAYAYLLFVLLYVPCISTMAAIRQESHVRWMWFSVGWSFLLAYGLAVMFYQLAQHL